METVAILEVGGLCLLMAVLLGLSAAFSGTEMALFSLTKLQLRRLRTAHPARGRIVSELLDQPHRLLSTILLGNTLVNVATAVLGFNILQLVWPARAAVLAVPVMTILILVFGEVAPKTVVLHRPEFYAAHLAVPLRWLVRVTRPMRAGAEAISGWLVRMIQRLPYFSARKVRSSLLTEDEYRTLLSVSERAGVLAREERVMVNKILALENTPVKEIMTPRVDMQCIEDSLAPEEMAAALRQFKHRRVPLIRESPDTVEGIINVKEFLIDPRRDLDEVMELPNFVPDTMNAARLLKSFRKQEHPVAIVVDEYGGTQGMVTLEDILEEIVGEIVDEFDAGEVMIQKIEPRRWLVNGKARLDLVNEQCGLNLQAEDVETIAGWMIAELGSLPREGDQVRRGRVRLSARKVAKNRVREILLEVDQS